MLATITAASTVNFTDNTVVTVVTALAAPVDKTLPPKRSFETLLESFYPPSALVSRSPTQETLRIRAKDKQTS